MAVFSRQLRSDFGRVRRVCFHQTRLATARAARLLVSIAVFQQEIYHVVARSVNLEVIGDLPDSRFRGNGGKATGMTVKGVTWWVLPDGRER